MQEKGEKESSFSLILHFSLISWVSTDDAFKQQPFVHHWVSSSLISAQQSIAHSTQPFLLPLKRSLRGVCGIVDGQGENSHCAIVPGPMAPNSDHLSCLQWSLLISYCESPALRWGRFLKDFNSLFTTANLANSSQAHSFILLTL